MTKLLSVLMLLALLTGCASVRVYDDYDGRMVEKSQWQTGLIGMVAEDVYVRHEDGSCVRVTWNKGSQFFIAWVGTKVYMEKKCLD